MINDIFYAQKMEWSKDKETLSNFYPSRGQVLMCTNDKTKIVKVRVRPVKPGEKSIYWGWHEFKCTEKYLEHEESYSMIWPDFRALAMCFTYGIKAEEEAGKGERINLVVEVLE